MPRHLSRIFVRSYQDYDLKCWWLRCLFISPSICRANTIHSHRPFPVPLWSLVSLPESLVSSTLPCRDPASRRPSFVTTSTNRRAELWKAHVEIFNDRERLPGGRRRARVCHARIRQDDGGSVGLVRRLSELVLSVVLFRISRMTHIRA